VLSPKFKVLLRSKTHLTGKGKPPLLSKAKTRSATKGKAPSTSKQSEYYDGHCQQLSKKQTVKQKAKTSLQKQTYMSASENPSNIGEELPTGGDQIEQISETNTEDELPTGSKQIEQITEINSGTMSVTFDDL